MKTVEVTIYKFNELSEEAKQKALNTLYDINVDYDWWCFTFDDAETIGLKITGFDLDRNRHATGEFINSAAEVAADIFKNHGEQCETYKTATSFMEEWQPVFNDYMDETSEHYESAESEDKLLELEEDFLNSLLEDYSIILQNESEHLMSEKAIIESIQANDYDFTEDGDLFNSHWDNETPIMGDFDENGNLKY